MQSPEAQVVKPAANQTVAFIVILLLLRLLLGMTYRSATSTPAFLAVDSNQYYTAAQRLNGRKPLYPPDIVGYPNAPLLAIGLRPVAAHLSIDAYHRLWPAVNMLCLSIALIAVLFATRVVNLWLVALSMIVCFRNWPTVLELGIGNVDLMITLCYAIAMAALSRNAFLSAVTAIAVAGSIKIWALTPLFGFLVCRRQGLFFAGLLIETIFLLLQFIFVGFGDLLPFLKRQISYSSQPLLVSDSIPGIARLLFRTNPVSTPWLRSEALYWLLIMTAVSVICLCYVFAFRFYRPHSARSNLLLFCISIPTMLILHPLGHTYIYSLLVLPLIGILCLSVSDLRPDRSSFAAAGICIGVYLVMTLKYPGLTPLADRYTKGLGILVICGWPLMAMLVLMAALILMRSDARFDLPLRSERQ